MLVEKPYNRSHANAYAQRWAESRNPLFFDFAGIGGDCTNFASQCVYAGSCTMNFDPIRGWYYVSANNRTPSWTGVEFFYDFLVNNKSVGPFGKEVNAGSLELGDIIQLGQAEGDFYHTLVVTGFTENSYLVSTHTYDFRNRPLNTYQYSRIRYLHIEGIRIEVPNNSNCFDSLLNGVRIVY